MFENLRGPLVVEAIQPVLEICSERLDYEFSMRKDNPAYRIQPTLMRSLFNVFLATTLQDIDKTLQFIESKSSLVDFLTHFIDAG